MKDVRWLTPAATDIEGEQWQDGNARCFGMLMDGRAQATGIKRPSMDATVLLVLNAYHDVVKFKLPEVVGGHTWRCLLDTNVPDRTATPQFRAVRNTRSPAARCCCSRCSRTVRNRSH